MYNLTPISYHPTELGLVASSRRAIVPGHEYNRFFGSANSATKIVKADADVTDTVSHALSMIKREAPSVLKLAKHLQKGNLQETSRSVFNFMYHHYQYKIDTPGQEQLRTPARAWKDRTTGIDCDCYSISVGAMLTALKIPFALRIIKMYNKAYYQHIYVVVPKTKGADLNVRSNYWVIDPVLDAFDKEAPYTAKKDYPVNMELAELSGITPEGTEVGQEFEGFGDTCEGSLGTYNARMRNHIANTRNAVAKNPEKVRGFYNPQKFIQVSDTVLKNWSNPATREAALAWASNVEMGIVDDDMQGLQGLMHGDQFGNELHDYLGNDINYLEGLSGFDLSGLGGLGALKTKGAKIANAKAKIANVAAKANTVKKGFFTKVKNAEKVVKTAAKNAKPPKAIVKKVVAATKKVNPISVTIRGAILAAMKLNVGHYSEKLKYAYGTQSAAEAAGFNYAQLVQTKDQVEKVFSSTYGGDPKKLREAILTHKNLLHKNVKGLDEVQGLGVVVATTAATSIAAASPFLAKIAGLLAKVVKNPAKLAKAQNFVKKVDTKLANKQGAIAKAKAFIHRKKDAKSAANNPGTNPTSDEEMKITSIPKEFSNQSGDGNKNTGINPGGSQNDAGAKQDTEPTDDNNGSKPKKKGNLLLYGGLALGTGLAIAAATGAFKSKPSKAVSGVKKSTKISL